MGFDFSALDADLAALGDVPSELSALAAQYAGPLTDLADVDRSLAALGEPVDLSRFAASVDVPRTKLERAPAPSRAARASVAPFASASSLSTESGEMSLPEPVVRTSAPPGSGELRLLDSEPPRSGSYALSEPPDEPDQQQVDASPRLLSDPAVTVESSIDDDSDVDDVLALFDENIDAGATPARPLKGLSDLPPAEPTLAGLPPVMSERDPDAEFDALFSDATSPSGFPSRGLTADDDTPSADDLLFGLEASATTSEANAAMEELYSEAEDRTEIIDHNTLKSITSSAPPPGENPFGSEELGSSEFEILLDDNEPVTATETIGAGKAQPPPPPGGEKRPSFLGRLFGRKEPTQ